MASKAIRLKHIEIQNFKSFHKASYSFPECGLVSLEADNKDTGGSSGAGKSTFLNAIAYALGYCEFPASTLKGWGSDDDMKVVLTLSTPEGDVEISKGAKNYIKVGTTTVTGAKSIEETLQKIVGLDSDTLKALVYRRQKSSGLFLTMDDNEKKDFLGRVLNLDQYEGALEKAKASVSRANTAVATTESIISSHGEVSKPSEPFIPELALDEVRGEIELHKKSAEEMADKETVINSQITDAVTQYNAKCEALDSEYAPKIKHLQSELDTYLQSYSFTPDSTELTACEGRIEKVKARLAKVTKELEDAKKAHQDTVKAKSGEIAKLTHLASGFKPLQVQLDQLKDNKAKLEESVCYTCERDGFFNPVAKQKLDDKILEVEGSIQMCVDATIQLPISQKELDSLQPPSTSMYDAMTNALAVEQAKKKSIQDSLLTQQKDAKRQHELGATDMKNKLDALDNEFSRKKSDAYSKHSSFTDKLRESKRAFSDERSEHKRREIEADYKLKKLFADYEIAKKQYSMDLDRYEKFQQLKDKLDSDKKVLSTHTALADMLKGFTGSIFEEILDEISDEANGILGTIPNVAHCSIKFNTEHVTQKGTSKQRITPVVSVGGNSGPIKSVCSGGMESSIELAVDIAVASVIARRTGASPQWIVLDEAFDGLDSVAKEACLEMLQKHANDKLVMVVSHVSDFREFFANSINIEYKEGKSTVA